ncbi:unnamed protein product, partial [Brassica oleracea]
MDGDSFMRRSYDSYPSSSGRACLSTASSTRPDPTASLLSFRPFSFRLCLSLSSPFCYLCLYIFVSLFVTHFPSIYTNGL